MNKELEEAIKYLKLIRKNHDLEKKGYVYTEEAIQTVLNYIENSISKEVIEEKIEELKNITDKYDKQRENDEETDLSYEEASRYASKLEVLQELLEGK